MSDPRVLKMLQLIDAKLDSVAATHRKDMLEIDAEQVEQNAKLEKHDGRLSKHDDDLADHERRIARLEKRSNAKR